MGRNMCWFGAWVGELPHQGQQSAAAVDAGPYNRTLEQVNDKGVRGRKWEWGEGVELGSSLFWSVAAGVTCKEPQNAGHGY